MTARLSSTPPLPVDESAGPRRSNAYRSTPARRRGTCARSPYYAPGIPPYLVTREPAGRPTSGGNSNGADHSRREPTQARPQAARSEAERVGGAFGNDAVTAEVRYSLVTERYPKSVVFR